MNTPHSLDDAVQRAEHVAATAVASHPLSAAARLIRDRLDDNTRELIDVEVDKNLTRRSAETIAEALDQR